MFGISVWKLLLVLMVALIVLGPDHLPKIAQTMGRMLGQLKKIIGTVESELNSLIADSEKESPPKEEPK